MFDKKKFQVLQSMAEKAASEYDVANDAYYLQTRKDIVHSLAEAEKISDAGERYFAFSAISGKVGTFQSEAQERVTKQKQTLFAQTASTVEKIVNTEGFGGFAIGHILWVPTILPIIIACFIEPFTGSYLVASVLVAEAGAVACGVKKSGQPTISGIAMRDIQVKQSSFCKELNATGESIQQKQGLILKMPVMQLSISSRFDELCKFMPKLKEDFFSAAREAVKEDVLPAFTLSKPILKKSI